MTEGDTLITRSCWDTVFKGNCYEVTPYADANGCRVEVSGQGWVIARKELVVDFDDPLTPGDGLAEMLMATAV